MAVALTGILGETANSLRNLIASSAAFRTWTGTADEAEARLRIHFMASAPVFPDKDDDVPFAQIGTNMDLMDLDQHGAGSGMALTGDLKFSFLDFIDPAVALTDEIHTFLNTIGAILTELDANKGRASGAFYYMDVQKIRIHPWALVNANTDTDQARQAIEQFFQAFFVESPIG